jgi:hypothetical protein
MPNELPVDLKPYLNNGLHVIVADWLYRTIFQPIVNVVESVETHFTRKWCERNTPKA